MTWRLRIDHRTGFEYESPVVSSYNEARLMPLSTPDQLVLEAEIRIDPAVGVLRYWDYWGTLVYAFDVHRPHTELVVTSTSVIEISGPSGALRHVGWDELSHDHLRNQFAELLAPTTYVPLDSESINRAAFALRQDRTPAETCAAASSWVREQLRYEQGATTVSSTAVDALHHGRGVCQDFAHVTLALLRSVGIPARYVSGYLHPSPDADVGTTVSGESHAWVEAWLGDWVPLDPTNGKPVGERHVVVARARDYADVSPLKGIYHGGSASALAVSVELTRLA